MVLVDVLSMNNVEIINPENRVLKSIFVYQREKLKSVSQANCNRIMFAFYWLSLRDD